MKKYGILIIVLTLAVVALAATGAEAADQTVYVTATASITGSTSLSVDPGTLTFGVTSADAYPTNPADKKITLTYTSNYNPWKIMVYTDNTQIPMFAEEDGRYSKGGLATADGMNVVPCKWVSKAPASAAPGVPAYGSYNFIKDKRDENDPLTLTYDESWAGAFAGGYPNIAYGGPVEGVCVDPTNSPTYVGETVTGSIAVYVAGLFGSGGMETPVPAAAGSYSSKIYFDLYHE